MSKQKLSLDAQIAEVETRLGRNRAQLRALAAEARSRVNVRAAAPVGMAVALAIGFAASRLTRKTSAPRVVQKGPRARRWAGALAATLLPRLIRPLQAAAVQWVHQRMFQAGARRRPAR